MEEGIKNKIVTQKFIENKLVIETNDHGDTDQGTHSLHLAALHQNSVTVLIKLTNVPLQVLKKTTYIRMFSNCP